MAVTPSPPLLADQVEPFVQRRQTGALMLAINGKTALLHLLEGEICYLFFGGKKGLDALSHLSDELGHHPTRRIRAL